MFGSETLEVAVGVVFVYILFSMMCSTIREIIESLLKSRAAYLEYGIRELLHDKGAEGIAKNFFNHPLIYSLYSDEYRPGSNTKKPAILANGGNLPSYIPAKNFAWALMDIAARGPNTILYNSNSSAPVISLDAIRANITNVQNPAVQRALLTAVDSAQGDFNKAQKNIEDWFNSAMDRVSGWYRRSTQWVTFFIGLVAAISFNVNTITVADYLYKNDTERAAIVAKARAAITDSNFLKRNNAEVKETINSISLPVGWNIGWGAPRQGNKSENNNAWNCIFGPVLGWLLTAFAATLGAPFWFDVLNKIMVIRSTVKPHEKSPEEASDDRQLPDKVPVGPSDQKPLAVSPSPPQLPNFSTDLQNNADYLEEEDGQIENLTSDENLPITEGGVA